MINSEGFYATTYAAVFVREYDIFWLGASF